MSNAQPVTRQHLVSQVLLKRFAVPGTRGSGWQLIPFDLDYPDRHRKSKSPRECGWIPDFVPYDSGSIEQIWREVEQRVPEALAAVDSSTPFDNPDHAEVLRDFVALHLVRSHRYRDVHRNAFTKARENTKNGLLQNYSEPLRREALRQTGLHLPGPRGLGLFAERLIESSEPVRDHVTGKHFRQNIEEMFQKVRARIASWQLEVIWPLEGQFLIGDTPAITLKRVDGSVKINMAVGDAGTIILPLSPYRLIALGPQNVVFHASKGLVDELNAIQVMAANKYVYLRPGSGLEPFIKEGIGFRPARKEA